MQRILALDTETGGFKAAENALLSISLIELAPDLTPMRELNLFLLPEPDRTVSEDAAKVNGYTPELWAKNGAIPLRDGFQHMLDWCGGDAFQVLAHNEQFDRGFVRHNEGRTGITLPFPPAWTCSLALFRALSRKLGHVGNHRLETLARLCGHWAPDYVRGAHGAREDALACAAGYRWLKQREGGAA